ncbi:MAG: hypothetical protein KF901_07580 [Myxococcales bacterium]|nr:hypothetical protein [Myxococcales bacterium]
MRLAAVLPLAASLAVSLAACSAPGPQEACEAYCDQYIFTCGGDLAERNCLWGCLAAMEWREEKGKRCHRGVRNEYACLATVTDCSFLLGARNYRRGDPCASEGNTRANACGERGVRSTDLVPLDGERVRESSLDDPDDEDVSSHARVDVIDLGI